MRLEDWDSALPLDDVGRASVAAIQAAAAIRPLPAKFRTSAKDGPAGSRPATPSQTVLRKLQRTDSPALGGSPRIRQLDGGGADGSLELDGPIATAQQFYDWFARVEASMDREQEDAYRASLDEVAACVAACSAILEQLDDARGLVRELDANYKFVEENSRTLQEACETLLDEQKHLLELTDAIASRLDYFRELELATRALSLPGESVVLQPDFVDLLGRLDDCLEFLKANRSFRDAEIYIIRFQQCLTRAMTLIKMFFLTTVKALGADVLEKTTGKELSETALDALLYAKFFASAKEVQPLLFELEKRSRVDPDEYASLLTECYATWFGVRNQLLASSLAEEVRRMDPANSDLIKLARAGCSYLRSVCVREWNLFRSFFSTANEDVIYNYLESLCDRLYDSLRPRILHESKLDVLCELCDVLQALMALDSSDEDDAIALPESDEDAARRRLFEASLQSRGGPIGPVARRSLGRLRFSVLLETVLQDAQTRLVFRAQAVIQAEVLQYAPTADDLDYPDKLKAAKRMSTLFASSAAAARAALVDEDGAGPSTLAARVRLPDDNAMATWYPALRRTLWVLTKLQSHVKSAIFEDFAGEAVTMCRQSIALASQKIAQRPNASSLDGLLFSIRHLLILKEMVRSIDMVQIDRAVDFGSVTDMLGSLLRNSTAIFNPNALFELASRGMPSFAETMKDAKHDLDGSLKTVCEDLIAQSALSVTLPLRSFLGRCASFLAAGSAKAGTDAPVPDLPAQSWAAPEEVTRLHDAFVAEGEGGLERGMTEILSKLGLWLSDRQTVGVLVPPMQDEVAETYQSFYNLVRSEYDFTVASALQPPERVRDRLRIVAGAASGSIKS